MNIDLGYEFEVKASATDAFDVLADVPTSASFFLKVDKLVDLGDGARQGRRQRTGVGQLED